MQVTILPSKIEGTVTAPSSKSATHRAIVLASLAEGTSMIQNPLVSDDTQRTIDGLQAMGIPMEVTKEQIIVHGGAKQLQAPTKPIFLGESGTSLRILLGVAALIKGETVFTGSKRLMQRPTYDLIDGLSQMGVAVAANIERIIVKRDGPLFGNEIHVDATKSSQFLTSLLLISPFAEEDVTLFVDDIRSSPYVTLTLAMMQQFGVKVQANEDLTHFVITKGQRYKPQSLTVEGDYSSSSYLLAAAAITAGKVTLTNLSHDSTQGDRYFLTLLEKMGCEIAIEKDAVTVKGPKQLSALTANMGNYPDIVQTVTVLAAIANGESKLTNIAHLQHKETDRLNDTAEELKKFGIQVKVTSDSLSILGGNPKGTTVSTHNDHRMAMAFSILGLAAMGKTTIENAEVVSKSYPSFFEDLAALGASVKEEV